jgi:hypothetical protein
MKRSDTQAEYLYYDLGSIQYLMPRYYRPLAGVKFEIVDIQALELKLVAHPLMNCMNCY